MERHSFFGYFTFVDPDLYGSSLYQFYDCEVTKDFGPFKVGDTAHYAQWRAEANTLLVFSKNDEVLFSGALPIWGIGY